jgi:uncharacterized membrane-anchored protein
MMPVSSASSPVDTAGSIATTIRTKSGIFRWIGTAIFVALLVVLVKAQILAKRFHPFLYWATIVASTTFGTTMADFADRSLGIG